MKKTIAACVAATLTTLAAISGGFYIYQHYTFVEGSILSDEFINSEMQTIQNVYRLGAMQGYAAGRKACNSDT
jgi:hypothetical protein